MKISDPLQFAKAPPKSLRAALIYGPNRALVAETIAQLRRSLLPADADDFSHVTITPETLKQNANILAEEMASLGFFAAKKVITLRDPADGVVKAITEALASPDAGHFLIIEGDELGPKSALRQWAEKANDAAAVACYNLDGAALNRFVIDQFRQQNATISGDAVTLLLYRLGNDLTPLANIIAQLVDYAGGDKPAIAENHVEALLVDQAEQDKDIAIQAFADGDLKTLDRALQDMHEAGHSVVGLLRIAQNYFYRLRTVNAAVKSGDTMDEAIKKLRPPLFFKAKNAFIRHARNWPVKRIDHALGEFLLLEAACKKTGTPELALVQQRLIALAQPAKR